MTKYGIAKETNDGISFSDGDHDELMCFCQAQRSSSTSKCLAHYTALFNNTAPTDQIKILQCPYGLNTSTPFGDDATPRIIYGICLTDGAVNPPEQIPASACIKQEDAESLLSLVKVVSLDIRNEEMDHFEAALHDARHLNHSITQHAERILANSGYPPETEWNMAAIQQDEVSRRALSIYAASRDLSDAISLHEISQDTSRANTQKTVTHIHKQFYRQLKISSERLASSDLQYTLGSTQKSLMLTPEFRLIPKILIDNAIKYSNRNSNISIEFIETLRFFKITCSNEGPIVRPDEYESLFRKGTRGSNKSGIKGRGIGLWLAKIIVEANMGTIKLEAQEKSRDYSGRKIGKTIVTIQLLPN